MTTEEATAIRRLLDDATIEHSGQTLADRVKLLVARDRNHARLVVEHARQRKAAEAKSAALLDACQTVLAIAENRQAGTWDDVMRLMRATIAEAKPSIGEAITRHHES